MAEKEDGSSTSEVLPPCSVVNVGNADDAIQDGVRPSTETLILGRIDRFELHRVIGRGGMAVVYLARDPKRTESVAVKILRAELNPQERMREFFIKEAIHGSQLSHPNILPVLEFNRDPAFFVMPYLERGSLRSVLKRPPLLSKEKVVDIAQQIASALAFAHSRGIIHRDLKSSNILLDNEGRVKVSDFGLALSLANDSLVDARKTAVEGTPNYMSPTVAAGEMEDTRCDIYSYGAVLYELLTGCPPYSEWPAKEVLQRIQEGPPTPILALNPNAPPALVRIAEKAMARELSERYVHMRYIEADLQAVREGRDSAKPNRRESSAAASFGRRARMGWPLAGGISLLVLTVWLAIHGSSSRARSTISDRSAAGAVAPTQLLRSTRAIGSPRITSWRTAKLVNLYRKGPPVIATTVDNRVEFVSLEGEALLSLKLPDPYGQGMRLLQQIDISQDNINEFLVGWELSSNVFVSVFSGEGHELHRFHTPGALATNYPGLAADAGASAADYRDLNGDGRMEMVALLAAGRALSPRGVCVWDFESKKKLWQYETAPGAIGLALADLNGDGKTELLMGSAAVDNAKSLADGTDDRHAYIYCLDHAGRLLWRTRVGDIFTKAFPQVLDFDSDGRPDILVWVSSDSEMRDNELTEDLPRIVRLDGNGTIIHQFGGKGIDLVSCLTADLDHDHAPEILAGDCQGRLFCLNTNLAVRQIERLVKKQYHRVLLKLAAVEDLDHDGSVEVVVTSTDMEIVDGMNPGFADKERNHRIYHDNEVAILNHRLQCLARWRLSPALTVNHDLMVYLADIDGNGRKELVVPADKVYELSFDNRQQQK